MKEVFKQLLLEFEKFEIPQGIIREIELPELPSQVRKAITFIGMRRSGKTWLFYQNIQKLLDDGISRDRILYINFEDERLREVQSKDLQSLLDAYFELNPQCVSSERIYLHFDEIQTVEGWERFVRRLLDSMQYNLYITGSSAKLLSKEIATELRGRSLTREVFPFSFSEFLQYHHLKPDIKRLTSKDRSVLLNHLRSYLKFGGFPETLGVSDWLHREILQNYVQTVIYRDIVERYKITNITVLERWVNHCLQNQATSLSINKIFNHFKSLGLQASKNSLYEWMDYLEDAYCIFALGCFDLSERKSSLKPKKIYSIDPGLVTAYAVHPEMKLAQTLEVAVFRALREQFTNLHYYVTSQGWEVDFIAQAPTGALFLIQVSLSLKEVETRKREVRALQQAMQELSLKEATLITFEEEEEIVLPEGRIDVVPLWKYLLN